MILVPLGISSATPTVHRSMPSVALWREGQVFLFDCGENTQARMLQAGMKRSKIDFIFISHLDGDHIFGLPGMLSTFHIQRRDKALTIVGPKGIKDYVEFNLKLADVDLDFPIEFVELENGFENEVVVDEEEFTVVARPLEHTRFCIGYRLEEKPKPGKVDAEKATEMGITEDAQFKELKKGNDVELADGTVVKSVDIVGEPREGNAFAYITDTVYNANSLELARNANLLYHEATFGSDLKDKAEETKHSTAEDAAQLAADANAKLLVIGHFSGRYTNPFVLMKEARRIFPETWIANEMRPIMTDLKHEKNIIQPRIPVHVPGQKNRRSGGRSSSYKSSSRKPRKARISKRRNKPVATSRGKNLSDYYRDRDRDRGQRYSDRNRDRNDRNERNDHNKRNNRDDRDRKKRDDKPPRYKPITPRTPFDDFNRF